MGVVAVLAGLGVARAGVAGGAVLPHGRGTSIDGFWSKKPNGLSQKAIVSAGMIGQSSTRVTWWMPKKFTDEGRALTCANNTEYGLASSVWTSNINTASRMASRLDFGCVWVNTHIPLIGEMPHGGVKHSGYGQDLSMYGLEDYTRIKHVMIYHGFEG